MFQLQRENVALVPQCPTRAQGAQKNHHDNAREFSVRIYNKHRLFYATCHSLSRWGPHNLKTRWDYGHGDYNECGKARRGSDQWGINREVPHTEQRPLYIHKNPPSLPLCSISYRRHSQAKPSVNNPSNNETCKKSLLLLYSTHDSSLANLAARRTWGTPTRIPATLVQIT